MQQGESYLTFTDKFLPYQIGVAPGRASRGGVSWRSRRQFTASKAQVRAGLVLLDLSTATVFATFPATPVKGDETRMG
jgi:hypothetical protein